MPRAVWLQYWDCWRDSMADEILNYMTNGDVPGLIGMQALAVASRGTRTMDYEAAICILFREVMRGAEEARGIRDRLTREGPALRARNLYDVLEERAQLLEQGLVPVVRVAEKCAGFRRDAAEIYREMHSREIIRQLEVALGPNRALWIGFDNRLWNGFVQRVETSGVTSEVWASSMGIILAMAITGKGFTTIIPLVLAMLIARSQNGEITLEQLYEQYARTPNPRRSADVILEKSREKDDLLKPFPNDDGRRLIANQNCIYAVGNWQTHANALARRRGLSGGP